MKKILNMLTIAALALLSACDLDLYPEDNYNQGNVSVDDVTENQYSTRADMLGLRNSIYNSWLKSLQEVGVDDWLVYSECRADNAYNGSPSTGEIVAIEANKQDAENKNVVRDWSWYLNQISNANQIICNIDDIAANDTSSFTMPPRAVFIMYTPSFILLIEEEFMILFVSIVSGTWSVIKSDSFKSVSNETEFDFSFIGLCSQDSIHKNC